MCLNRLWNLRLTDRVASVHADMASVQFNAPIFLLFVYEQRWILNTTASKSLPFLSTNWISPTLIFKGSVSLPLLIKRRHTHKLHGAI